jgi:hypothetical protein
MEIFPSVITRSKLDVSIGNQALNSSDAQCDKELPNLPFCYAARQYRCLAVHSREPLNIMISIL